MNSTKNSELTPNDGMSTKSKKQTLSELFFYFLKVGTIGFGGPLSVISIFQQDWVENKKWIERDKFNQAFTLIKAMPGPISFMMTTYLGRLRGGFFGAVVSAIGFVLPAFIMVVALAEFYAIFSHNSDIVAFFDGFKAAAFALIVVALKSLIQKDYKRITFWVLITLAAVLFFYNLVPEPLIIIGFGALYVLAKKNDYFKNALPAFLVPFTEEHLILFGKCLKAGALVFGTGFAILPVLKSEFVDQLQWIDTNEFLNAVAFGQITPGPVVITGTYIGYKVLGFSGALLATIGIFLPSFFHITTWFSWLLNTVNKTKWIYDFIFAATAAVVGTLLVTFALLGKDIFTSPSAVIIFMVALGLNLVLKWSPILVIILGGVMQLAALRLLGL